MGMIRRMQELSRMSATLRSRSLTGPLRGAEAESRCRKDAATNQRATGRAAITPRPVARTDRIIQAARADLADEPKEHHTWLVQ